MTLSLNQFKAFEISNANKLTGGAVLCMVPNPYGDGDIVELESCWEGVSASEIELDAVCFDINVSCDVYNQIGG